MEMAIRSLGEEGKQSAVIPQAGLGDGLDMPELLVLYLLLCHIPEQSPLLFTV